MIVIPMAGGSSRFYQAGYELPKFMLELHGRPVFDWSVLSFSKYFDTDLFVFIIQRSDEVESFLKARLSFLGVKLFLIHKVDRLTRGQAETVYCALNELEVDQEFVIFNVDTFRPGYDYPKELPFSAPYLEVFRGEGSNWSFVKPSRVEEFRVLETAEKKPISDLCSTGLYYFSSVSQYMATFDRFVDSVPESEWVNGELYVAPLYNTLILQEVSVYYSMVERTDVIFCGVPEEYERLQENSSNFLSCYSLSESNTKW